MLATRLPAIILPGYPYLRQVGSVNNEALPCIAHENRAKKFRFSLTRNVMTGSAGMSFSQGTDLATSDIIISRTLLMDKEVITRTSGRKLGYIHQLYVDPVRLEVFSIYLRPNLSNFAATSSAHVLLSSLRQIGDVVLVHDEKSLMDPPGDESFGYVPLIGSEVQTEDGQVLGKVRDYLFNPDDGRIMTVRYDALGIPSIPQSLLTCYSINWRDIVAVGPNKMIVSQNTMRRAVKENDGWISEYVATFVNLVAGNDGDSGGDMTSSENYRKDPAYAAWYSRHAAAYEQYYGEKLPKPIVNYNLQDEGMQRKTQRNRPSIPAKPLGLPPPRSSTFKERVDMDQNFEERSYQESLSRVTGIKERSISGRPRAKREGTLNRSLNAQDMYPKKNRAAREQPSPPIRQNSSGSLPPTKFERAVEQEDAS
jgi:sporulation protein YlmC with PRC-barrel domain